MAVVFTALHTGAHLTYFQMDDTGMARQLRRILVGARRFSAQLYKLGMLKLAYFYLRLARYDRLSDHIKDIETNLRRADDHGTRIEGLLGSDKVNYLDIGARGGLSGFLERYRDYLACILAEPDPLEAKALQRSGYLVVNCAISGEVGEATLYVARKPGLSSLLQPNGELLEFYRSGSDRFDVVDTISVRTTTIGELSSSRNLSVDLLKIDTQGSELDILKGMGGVRPLLIISEISFAELYCHQATVFELGAHLRELGYIPWDVNFQYTPPPGARPPGAYVTGLPIHGDACFMPNWANEKGMQIILQNECKWAALMLMYGLEDVLRYVVTVTSMPKAKLILSALENRAVPAQNISALERVRY